MGTTLGIFHPLTKRPKFSSLLSPLTPLQNNPDFPPGLGNQLLRPSDKQIPLLTAHCFKNKTIKNLTELRADNNVPTLPMWTYLQICSYVNNTSRQNHFTRDLNEMESVCLKGEQVSKTTSTAYKWLQIGEESAIDRFRERWSDSLDMTITDTQWERACIMAHKCSLSTKIQETAYKVLTHWYATPAKIHKWFPQSPDTCWRCNRAKGTLLHVWWQCERIMPFWNKV